MRVVGKRVIEYIQGAPVIVNVIDQVILDNILITQGWRGRNVERIYIFVCGNYCIVGIVNTVLADDRSQRRQIKVYSIINPRSGAGRAAKVVAFYQGTICVANLNTNTILILQLVTGYLVINGMQATGIAVYNYSVIATINDVVLEFRMACIVPGSTICNPGNNTA